MDGGDETSWKDLDELDAPGTTQKSFDQQFLTAKLFPFVMFQDKDEPVHDQLLGTQDGNLPLNMVQAKLAALGPISKLVQVK